MAEIKRKPSLKPNIVGLCVFFGVLVLVAILGIIISTLIFGGAGAAVMGGTTLVGIPIFIAFVGFIMASVAIMKLGTTYTITEDNEIVIHFSFLRTMTMVYRLDQLTTLRYQQNLIERWLGLATIHFGVFGQKSESTQTQQKDGVQRFLERKMVAIPQGDEVYHRLMGMLKVEEEPVLYQAKPVVKPVLFKVVATLLIYAAVIAGTLVSGTFFPEASIVLMMSAGIITLITVFVLIGFVVDWLKLRRTTYAISETAAYRAHDYFFSKQHMVVPMRKITNTKTIRNVFSYLLFKAGSVQLYTGGSDDPFFRLFREYREYADIVSKKYGTVRERIKKETSEAQQEDHEIYRPGASYLPNRVLGWLITLLILGTSGSVLVGLQANIPSLFHGVIWGVVVVLWLLVSGLTWWQRSVMRYYVYENRLVIRYGILTLRTEELYYRNVKYVSLSRPYLFTKFCGEGTIHIFTAGTGGADHRLSSIPQYHKVYDRLKERILEE